MTATEAGIPLLVIGVFGYSCMFGALAWNYFKTRRSRRKIIPRTLPPKPVA